MPAFAYTQSTARGGDPDRLSRLPSSTWVAPDTTPEQVAEFCVRHAERARSYLEQAGGYLRKWQYLERAINDPELAKHPDRNDAIERRDWYAVQVRADLLSAILEEHRGDLKWRYLDQEERIFFGGMPAHAWHCDSGRESLIGLLFCSNHPWVSELLGSEFNLKDTIGHIPDLSRGIPYREDLAEYISRGWLNGDPGKRWEHARETDMRRQAVIDANRSRRRKGQW